MTQQNTRVGIWLAVVAMFVFAMQDGISRHLAEQYSVFMIVMIRYWFFLLFVMALSKMRTGSVIETARTEQPILQFFRGVLLATEILVTVVAFTMLGLIEAHAIFAIYPLIVAAFSGPILGETVGWRRWVAGRIVSGAPPSSSITHDARRHPSPVATGWRCASIGRMRGRP